MAIDKHEKPHLAHVLAIPFQGPGHINPALQLCKRLVSKGLKATLAITKCLSKTMYPKTDTVGIDVISDGYDDGGFFVKDNIPDSIKRFTEVGSESISELLRKYEAMGQPVDCIVYDSLFPWMLDVAKKFGILGGPLFTMQVGMNYTMYRFYHGLLEYPVKDFPAKVPGLPALQDEDLPLFSMSPNHYVLVANQLCNVDQADFVLVNSFYELEKEVVDVMSKDSKLMPIGPTIPSYYLDNRVENDKEYGLNWAPVDPPAVLTWLDTKPTGSVVYVSFSSYVLGSPSDKQMVELAFGLQNSNYNFIWVVKEWEMPKLPQNFLTESSQKGLIVQWSPQLEVLKHKATGCIVTHCGWNSTIEAICLGVPIVAMPHWADQTINGKCIQDVWKVGVRVKVDENGLVGREEFERCVRTVMEGEKAAEIKESSKQWGALAKAAVSEGGSSDNNLNEFVSTLKEFASSRS